MLFEDIQHVPKFKQEEHKISSDLSVVINKTSFVLEIIGMGYLYDHNDIWMISH